jgi:hypothetical protein
MEDNMKRKGIAIILVSLVLVIMIRAEEGMWLLSQIKDLKLEQKGFQISADEIYNSDKVAIANAIVWLGNCSASFVSDEGLLLTNHHCAYGALQRSSAKDSIDYIKNGFLAHERNQELPAIGQKAYVLESVKDVTTEVVASAKGVEDVAEKEKIIEQKIAQIEKAAEGDREDLLCQVATMYNGKQYIEYLFKKYQDVRIVFAPPEAIGKYGGEIDNWMWPRHTGDFTYMRVYQAPDGSGAKYSPDNVPVKPKNHVKIAQTDLKDGDMTFILGFPGQTMRYRTSYSSDWNLNRNYIPSIKEFQEILNIIEILSRDNPEAAIKLANYNVGINNVMKNYQGNVDGMKKSNFIAKKRAYERELLDFLKSKPKLQKKYGDVLDQIGAQYTLIEKSYDYDWALQTFQGYSIGVLYRLAGNAYDVARERAKPEADRKPEFSEKRVHEAINRIDDAYLGFYEPFDKAMLKRALTKAAALPEAQRIVELDYIVKSDLGIDGWIEDAFQKTGLKDAAYVKALYEKSAEEIEALGDPLLDLAIRLYEPIDRKYERDKIWNAKIKNLREEYINALYAWKGKNLYPDANSTIRFTYGAVRGYSPADAIYYRPFTTLKGVLEKDTGVEPFNAPAKLTELYQKKDFGKWVKPELNDVSVCFLCLGDITGGNSGSAVMNARGELIGLAFDGNYEAMTSDWLYDPEIQRTIAVDVRYVLFITEKFAGADYLLKEMGL